MPNAAAVIAEKLGYRFSDESLLERALTHRSARHAHNERLEFLGDAILNFITAELLYRRFPDAREGRLTRLRAALVRRETLADIARCLGLGELLCLGPGEVKSGGRDRDSILANALEALVGAMFLDSDIEACRRAVTPLFVAPLVAASSKVVKDPKTRLQEYLQARSLPLPDYSVTSVETATHEHSFTVECRVPSIPEVTVGSGPNRRSAEQEAARKALSMISRNA
jgi:ribonuclease-3